MYDHFANLHSIASVLRRSSIRRSESIRFPVIVARRQADRVWTHGGNVNKACGAASPKNPQTSHEHRPQRTNRKGQSRTPKQQNPRNHRSGYSSFRIRCETFDLNVVRRHEEFHGSPNWYTKPEPLDMTGQDSGVTTRVNYDMSYTI